MAAIYGIYWTGDYGLGGGTSIATSSLPVRVPTMSREDFDFVNIGGYDTVVSRLVKDIVAYDMIDSPASGGVKTLAARSI